LLHLFSQQPRDRKQILIWLTATVRPTDRVYDNDGEKPLAD
jgi:hypothetical protein